MGFRNPLRKVQFLAHLAIAFSVPLTFFVFLARFCHLQPGAFVDLSSFREQLIEISRDRVTIPHESRFCEYPLLSWFTHALLTVCRMNTLSLVHANNGISPQP